MCISKSMKSPLYLQMELYHRVLGHQEIHKFVPGAHFTNSFSSQLKCDGNFILLLSKFNEPIDINFCPWYNSCTVVACAQHFGDIIGPSLWSRITKLVQVMCWCQAITCANVNADLWHHVASPGHEQQQPPPPPESFTLFTDCIYYTLNCKYCNTFVGISKCSK